MESAIINKALLQFADYLTAIYNCPKQTTGISQTSGVIFDNSDLAKCTEEVGGTLGNALTNPVYGVWDICQSAMKYHGCLKTLFSKANSTREKFISMTMRQTYMDIESFVNGTCAAMSKMVFYVDLLLRVLMWRFKKYGFCIFNMYTRSMQILKRYTNLYVISFTDMTNLKPVTMPAGK